MATRFITVFGIAQGFRGAFGANPCGFYRMHSRYLWMIWWGITVSSQCGPWEKVLRGLWEREIDLYIVDSFGEGLRLSIVRMIITWLIIMLSMHWSKLSTLIILEVKPPNKSKDETVMDNHILRGFLLEMFGEFSLLSFGISNYLDFVFI